MRTHHPPPRGFDKFIARARDLHGERFQYDRSSWVDADNHVRIQCEAHGWFKQISRNHLRPKNFGGCYACKENDNWEHQFDRLVAKGLMPSPRKQVAASK